MTTIATTSGQLNNGLTYSIPLSNRPGHHAELCSYGRDLLVMRGVRSLFMSTDGARQYSYVSCYDPNVPGQLGTVARYLVNAKRGQRVRYRDGDRTNLRLSNLHVEHVAMKMVRTVDGGAR